MNFYPMLLYIENVIYNYAKLSEIIIVSILNTRGESILKCDKNIFLTF